VTHTAICAEATWKERAILGAAVETIVPSRFCMNKVPATSTASGRIGHAVTTIRSQPVDALRLPCNIALGKRLQA
jgi:hypothetical protein